MNEDYEKVRLEKIEKKLSDAIREGTDRYLHGDDSVVHNIIEASTTRGGLYMVRVWPADSTIDITYTHHELRFADTGDRIASYSIEYFSIKQIAKLSINAIDTYEYE